MDDRTLARFLTWVEVQPNGCWRWKGKPTPGGYGRFSFDGTRPPAHRVAYEHYVKAIPKGLDLDHLCHTRDKACPGGNSCPHRLCVNPAHLEPVTRRENLLRGRSQVAANAAKTHCPQGHPYDEANIYWHRGNRHCRICRADQIAAWNAGRKRPRRVVTHCPAGHEYTPENSYYPPAGGRKCRECTRKKVRESQRRRRARAKRQTAA